VVPVVPVAEDFGGRVPPAVAALFAAMAGAAAEERAAEDRAVGDALTGRGLDPDPNPDPEEDKENGAESVVSTGTAGAGEGEGIADALRGGLDSWLAPPPPLASARASPARRGITSWR